jgi:hypothetical protein
MEQILTPLLARIYAIQGKMDSCHERMEAKLGAKIKTTKE